MKDRQRKVIGVVAGLTLLIAGWFAFYPMTTPTGTHCGAAIQAIGEGPFSICRGMAEKRLLAGGATLGVGGVLAVVGAILVGSAEGSPRGRSRDTSSGWEDKR